MSAADPIAFARAVLRDAVAARIFPAAVAEIGSSTGVLWREPFGTLTFEPDAAPVLENTIFDLASLTKPLATTSVVLQLMADHALSLEDTIVSYFPEWSGADRHDATLQDLLEHASGLPARLLDAPPATRREFEHDICATPLEYLPRSRSIYSDLDFILLGFLAADRGMLDLAEQFRAIYVRVMRALKEAVPAPVRDSSDAEWPLMFGVPSSLLPRTAPTRPLRDDPRRGRLLIGVVHDYYAAALGGIAGHAGLFGSAPAVGTFARTVLRGARGDTSMPSPFTPPLAARAVRKSAVPGSSRALGWDTMLPTSSCGGAMSPAAFGHVGFTGTSLWIDPRRDRYFVLLTNRVCDGGTSDAMQTVRRAFHDALAQF
jgi:CubicO group peptidase (beta-lactamase class C family)